MKTTKCEGGKLLGMLFVLVLLSVSAFGQPSLPPMPVVPLDSWYLVHADWKDDFGNLPLGFTNLNTATGWTEAGTCLSVDTNGVAYLDLNTIAGGEQRFTLDAGTISLWFQANWTSTTDGGTGPGDWASLLTVGQWTSNATASCWSVFIDPNGTNLTFLAQSNGTSQIVLTAPIDFDAGDWHNVCLAYSATNCWLFLEGQAVTNAGAIEYSVTDSDFASYGAFVGSESSNGVYQTHGQFQDLESYNGPLSTNEIAQAYSAVANVILNAGGSLPNSGTFGPDVDSPPDPGGGITGGGGGPDISYQGQTYTVTTNYLDYTNFWLEITNSADDAIISIDSALPGLTYEILTNVSLATTNWGEWQTILASNSLSSALPTNFGSNTLFFKGLLLGYLGSNDFYPGPNWNGAPSILTQPESLIVDQGSTATFNVDAIGATPLYSQWRFDGTNIVGATGSSYTISNVQSSNAGWYVAVISNSVASVTSSLATLTTFTAPPCIITQPASLTVGDGSPATFAVFAGGGPPLNYQWKFNGTNISGATNTSYTISDVQSNNAGTYAVVITNAYGSLPSADATLTRTSTPPTFVYAPISQTVAEGDTVTFSCRAIGTEPISYQWNFTSLGSSSTLSCQSNRYVDVNMQGSDAGTYTVTASNAITNASEEAVLTDAGAIATGILPVFGPRQDYTFQANLTYYVYGGDSVGYPFSGTSLTGPIANTVDLYGTTTIQGGCVIKFDYDDWLYAYGVEQETIASLVVHGPLICATGPYNPAVLTSSDDDSQGEGPYVWWSSGGGPDFDFSSGEPLTAANGCAYLNLDDVHDTGGTSIKYLRFCYADQAVTTPTNSGVLDIWNCQFLDCNSAVNNWSESPSTDRLHNDLFSGCAYVFSGQTNSTELDAEQITADVSSFWNPVLEPVKIRLTNSIIVGDFGSGPNISEQDVSINPTGPTFQKVDSGNYYLANNSSSRNNGTTNISALMLQELSNKTTQPPISMAGTASLSNLVSTSDGVFDLFSYARGLQIQEMTLFPTAKRYADGALDRGYYYDPLDYTFGVTEVTNSVTVLPGTVVGIRGDHVVGFLLQNGASFNAQGMPTNPIIFARNGMVQEGPLQAGLGFQYPPMTAPWYSPGVPVPPFDFYGGVDFFCPESGTNAANIAPNLNLNFCDFYMTADDQIVWAGDYSFLFGWGCSPASSIYWTMKNCDLEGGGVTLGPPLDDASPNSLYPSGAIYWTNNVFDGVGVYIDPSYNTNESIGNEGTNNLDFSVYSYNNLFKGCLLNVTPTSGSTLNWFFDDNLFDQVSFVQPDLSELIDSRYNAYWLARDGSQLRNHDANIVTNDQYLTSSPPYESGPFGNYYMASNTNLSGKGSTAANLLGLCFYTTSTDESPQGTSTVDIGPHYVAASQIGGVWVPLETNDIPDYLADVAGTGSIPSGATNANSSYYTNIDLDGDGMVGSIEAALGGNPLVFDNPLSLSQVSSGEEASGIYKFVVSNSFTATNGQLMLMVDGVPAMTSTNAVDGDPELVWNSSTYAPGQNHYLQAHFILSGSSTTADGPFVEFALPGVLVQPANQTNGLYGSATFAASNVLSGSYSYQWQVNGVNISGATNGALIITNLVATNSGSYTVIATTSGGKSFTSPASILTVSNIYVGITTEPMSQTAFEPDNVTFAVTAIGTNLSYQWKKIDQTWGSPTYANFVDIPNATSSNYTIDHILSGSANTYAVLVSIGTNQGGTNAILSSAATLTDEGNAWNTYPCIYVIGPRQNYTFKSGITYLVGYPLFPGRVDLYGVTTMEAGTVIKFDFDLETNSPCLNVHGDLNCMGAAYRPVQLTSMDDDSEGEEIGTQVGFYVYLGESVPFFTGYYSTGVPQTAPSDTTFLNLDDAKASVAITNLHIAYAGKAITIPTNSGSLQLWDSQFFACDTAISGAPCDYSTNGLHNVLFANCGVAVTQRSSYAELDAEQITASVGLFCDSEFPPSRVCMTNCIIYGDLGTEPSSSIQKVETPSTWPFQTVGDGNYYLPAGSPYRNAGLTGISAGMQLDLTNKTTYAPIAFPTGMTISGQVTLFPQAARYAGGAPDLGYAYDPMDYTMSYTLLQGGTITALRGTAIGFRNDLPGAVVFGGNSLFSAQGTPTQPVTFVDNSLVQEGPYSPGEVYNQYWGYELPGYFGTVLLPYGGPAFFVPSMETNDVSDTSPQLNLRFCNFYMTQDDFALAAGSSWDQDFQFSDAVSVVWNMQDCNLYDGQVLLGNPLDTTTNSPGSISWTNTLFANTWIMLGPSSPVTADLPVYAFNNLFKEGQFVLYPVMTAEGNWQFRNNLFDLEDFSQSGSVDYSYNGWWTNAGGLNFFPGSLGSQLSGSGANDQILTNSPPYQNGPYGVYYQPNNSPLLYRGSAGASALGLAAFTVLTNGSEEETNTVSIGLHYIAVDSSGAPFVSGTNGLPDWWQYLYFNNTNLNPAMLATNGDGYSISNMYQLGFDPTISYPNPVILQSPFSTEAYIGSAAGFSVIVEGNPPIAYQWLHNGNPILGSTNAALSLPSVQFADAGDYSVVVESGTNMSTAVESATLSVLTNLPPVANQNVFGVAENSSANQLDVLQGDFDPNGDMFYISAIIQPKNGNVVYTSDGSTFQYTPNNGFFGVDSFEYTIANLHGGTASSAAAVFVAQSGDVFPSLPELIYTLQTNQFNITFNPSTNSTASTNLLFSYTAPKYGSLSTNLSGDITYVRQTNCFGNDMFTYVLTDGVGGFAVGSVAVDQVDTVGAGLPDQWQLAYGMDPTTDNTEGDPDDDGLPNLAEFLLGTDPLVADNPLNLPGITNGMLVSGVIAFPLSGISQVISTPTVSLFVNGNPASDISLNQRADGVWTLDWDTSFMTNGTYSIQVAVEYGINNEIAYGGEKTVQVNNAMTFDRLTRQFTDNGLIIDSTLAISNANYIVQLFNENGNSLTSWKGSTTNGQIDTYWDLTDMSGNKTSSGSIEAAISFAQNGPVSQTDVAMSESSSGSSGNSGSSRGSSGVATQSSDGPAGSGVGGGGGSGGGGSGNQQTIFHSWYKDVGLAANGFVVAWGWDSYLGQFEAHHQTMIEDGVISILANPADSNPYTLGPCCIWNLPSSSASTFRYDTENDKQILLGALQQNNNFFWLGHGNWNTILGNADKSNISAKDVQDALKNKLYLATPKHPQTNAHPYKLVVLNGCQTDGALWPVTFGIDYSPIGTTNYVVEYVGTGRTPRACVTWTKENLAPGAGDVTGYAHEYFTSALSTLWGEWMSGFPLNMCLEDFAASATNNGFTGQDSWHISGCYDLQRGE